MVGVTVSGPGVPDIRESGPTGTQGTSESGIRDIRNTDQGWGYQAPSLISLIHHSFYRIFKNSKLKFKFSLKQGLSSPSFLSKSAKSRQISGCVGFL